MNQKKSSPQVFFIFGNQSFEIETEVNNIVNDTLNEEEQKHSLFSFKTSDFFSQDRKSSQKALNEFRSTCETISFFSSKTVIILHDVQNIPSKKSPLETLENHLRKINLVKVSTEPDADWFDADSLSEQMDTHHHITGWQLIRDIECYKNKTFFFDVIPEFRNRLIHRKKGTGQDTIELTEFLKNKIKGTLLFERPSTEAPLNLADNTKPTELIKRCVQSPPSQIVLIITAHIKNIREVKKEIGNHLQKYAKVIKKTIAYDNFRPVPWIIKQAKSKNLIIDTSTADLLIEIAGTEFFVLDMELEKLSILFPAGTEITEKALFSSVSHSRRFTIFRAAEFLQRKELRGALECIEQVVGENPADAIGLFSLIVFQFRRMLKISWLMDSGLVEKRISDKLKLNPWAAKQTIKHVRNFTTSELENIVVYLAKLDLQVKYAAKDALIILENICFQICPGALITKGHLDRKWCP